MLMLVNISFFGGDVVNEWLDRESYLKAVELVALCQVESPLLLARVARGLPEEIINETKSGFASEFWPLLSMALATRRASIDLADFAQEILADEPPEEFFIIYTDLLRDLHSSVHLDQLVARWHGTWLAACAIRPALVSEPIKKSRWHLLAGFPHLIR